MPPLPLPHMVEWWTEIGMTGSNGMSATPLSWTEIAAWQTNTCVTLTPWEARLIRSLSIAYLVQSRLSEAETCPPPWRGEVTEADKAAEVSFLDAVLG
jgi:hypothetical protein